MCVPLCVCLVTVWGFHHLSCVYACRSLPNWLRLYQGSKVSRHADDLEKMQSVYAKESVTLTNNLGSDLLRQSHVMLNHENLRMLAIFHESLVCVCVGVRVGVLVGVCGTFSFTYISTVVNFFQKNKSSVMLFRFHIIVGTPHTVVLYFHQDPLSDLYRTGLTGS